jgi:4-amino-4-deoxy-L-arabinose transferase-like glycosyltransferase
MATTTDDDARRIGLADRVGRLFAFATASHLRAITLLVFVSLLAFLPGFAHIPPIDRDEPRYAQATKQMMETGNYLDIRYQDQPRYLQPAGIYWLQAGAAWLSGNAPHAPIWVHRLPSLIGATAAVVLTYWVALPLAGAIGALMAALFMASSFLLGFEARLAKTDAVLLATCLGALGFLARAYLGKPIAPLGAMLFWTALAAGTLIKGPLIVFVVGSPALVLSLLDRSFAWLKVLRPAYGACLYLLLVLPWLVAISMLSSGGFLHTAIGQSFLGKVAAGQQGHGAPPGFYLLAFWLTFWPAAGLAIIAAPWAWKSRHERAVRFCLAWIIPIWIVFELVVTKLPHYVLPVYPAIAILIALALLAGRRPGPVLGTVIATGGALYLILQAGILYGLEGAISPAALVLALAGALVLAWGVRCAMDGLPEQFAAGMAGGALLLHGAGLGLVLPRLDSVWISPRLAAAVQRNAGCAAPLVASAGHHEPSLVFLVGTKTSLTDGAGAAEALAEGGCRIALVEHRQEPAFLEKLAQLGRQAMLRERVAGTNLGKVARHDVGVYSLQSP